MKMNDGINRSRSLKLIGELSITKFVAIAREKAKVLRDKISNKTRETRKLKTLFFYGFYIWL